MRGQEGALHRKPADRQAYRHLLSGRRGIGKPPAVAVMDPAGDRPAARTPEPSTASSAPIPSAASSASSPASATTPAASTASPEPRPGPPVRRSPTSAEAGADDGDLHRVGGRGLGPRQSRPGWRPAARSAGSPGWSGRTSCLGNVLLSRLPQTGMAHAAHAAARDVRPRNRASAPARFCSTSRTVVPPRVAEL